MIEDFSSQFSPFCPYAKDLSLFSKHPVYIHIYIYREREREKEKEKKAPYYEIDA